MHVGTLFVHCPSVPHCRVESPVSLWPLSHVYVATDPTVVPEDSARCPLSGTPGSPQSLATVKDRTTTH